MKSIGSVSFSVILPLVLLAVQDQCFVHASSHGFTTIYLNSTLIPRSPPVLAPRRATVASVPLYYVGWNNGLPASRYPLKLCQGDCDNDGECDSGLSCFQRGGTQAVPGCIGGGTSGIDYCYSKDNSPPPPTPAPHSNPPTDGAIPLFYIGWNNGSPSNAFPLGRCQGDCDNNGECGTGLSCFQRNAFEPVPGCSGGGTKGIDYCYAKNPHGPPQPTPQPTSMPTPAPQNPTPNPTHMPTVTPTPPPTPAPQNPTPQPTPQPSRPSTPKPTPTGGPPAIPLFYKGWNNGSPSNAFPLGRCQGDCDNNGECGTGLSCFQRNGFESVPGCLGQGTKGIDYCYGEGSPPTPNPPTPQPTPSPPTPGGGKHRIRLYWQKNYRWQESSKERFYCMVKSGSEVKIQTCKSGSTKWEFLSASGNGDMIRMSGSNMCMELSGSRTMKLRTCSTGSTRQRWVAGKGSFRESRFDIRPVINTGRCLSQHHHPKPGELVYAETCSKAHGHTTGYWTKY